MKKAAMVIVASALVTSPVQAADWSETKPGTFVGLRLTMGGRNGAHPSAGLAIAPTQTRTSYDGMISTRIGDGLALNFSRGEKPALTLAGVRADTALGLHRNGDVNAEKKLGVSTGGWVAIGLGVAAVAAGAYTLHVLVEADKNSD